MSRSLQSVIPQDEVNFHPHSFGDPDGRLFRWNGELYRGIRAEKAPLYSRLFRDGVMERLMERGLFVKSEVTEFKLDDYPLVVHHRTVPFLSYPNEWCAAMFKDATLAVLELGLALAREHLTLKDHHLWNLLFDAGRPVYVDLTSIVPIEGVSRWPNYDKFCRSCLFPLLLMASGHERIARHLLPDYEGVQQAETVALTNEAPRSIRKLLRYRPRASSSPADYLKELCELVGKIELPAGTTSAEIQPSSLETLLRDLRPQSVLDIASPGGSGAKLAGRAGIHAVYFDADPARVAQVYRETRANGLTLPLVMDFTKPTPSIGFSGHYSIAASERLPCEMLLAYDLVHRLVFERYLNFEQITEGLATFTKRWAIVDFTAHISERFPSYSLDAFCGALRKQFRRVDATDRESNGVTRVLCEK